jgi:protein TonB
MQKITSEFYNNFSIEKQNAYFAERIVRMTRKTFEKRLTASAIAVTILVSVTSAFSQAVDWNRQVFRLMASHQTYPRAAQMRGEEGTARVRVYVDPAGAIQKVELVGPSGSTILDREAVALPIKVGKFPAPPVGTTTIVLPLTWKLL